MILACFDTERRPNYHYSDLDLLRHTPRTHQLSSYKVLGAAQQDVSFRIGCNSFSTRPSHQRSETLKPLQSQAALQKACRRRWGTTGDQAIKHRSRPGFDTDQLNLVWSNTNTQREYVQTLPNSACRSTKTGDTRASTVSSENTPAQAHTSQSSKMGPSQVRRHCQIGVPGEQTHRRRPKTNILQTATPPSREARCFAHRQRRMLSS